jgi:hypothetical protein
MSPLEKQPAAAGEGRRMSSAKRRAQGLISLVLGLMVIFSLVGVALPGTARAQEDQEPDATLRIVHASPGAPAIDVLVDGQPFAANVAFGAATDYAAIPAGDYKVQVVAAGQSADTAVIDMDLEAESGKSYIFAAAKPLNEIEGKLFEVNLDAVEEGKARVRAIHLSPDAGDIDVVVTGGDELFGGIGFEDTSDYTEIDPGTNQPGHPGEEDRILTSAAGIEIVAGGTYDIIALGQLSDQSLTLLPLVTNVSRPCATVLGLETAASRTAASRRPRLPRLAGRRRLRQRLAGRRRPRLRDRDRVHGHPAGDNVQIQVTAEGAALDTAVIDSEQDLEAGMAYDLVAVGPLDEIELTVSELNLTPLPEGQARVRITHASPDVEGISLGIAESDNLVEGVEYKSTSDYSVVDAGEYTFDVRTGEDIIALTQDVPLEPGAAYDLYVVGRQDDGSLALLVLMAQAAEREGGVATPVASGEDATVATVARWHRRRRR